jgi:two-component system NarL family response regulator
MISVLLVDDHPIVCEGWASIVRQASDMTVAGEAHNGKIACDVYPQVTPDVVLMDLRMPVWDGITAIEHIIENDPDAAIIVMTTMGGDEDIYRALEAGAKGYLLKDAGRDRILKAIRDVYAGRKVISPDVAGKLVERMQYDSLSERELDVLKLIAKGQSNREIAQTLHIAEGTVKTHVHRIMSKLQASDRTRAVMIALQRGILHL